MSTLKQRALAAARELAVHTGAYFPGSEDEPQAEIAVVAAAMLRFVADELDEHALSPYPDPVPYRKATAELEQIQEAHVAQNTDRELWRETQADHYSPSIHVTAQGAIGMHVGGLVIVLPLREWHRLAREASSKPTEQTAGEGAVLEAAARELEAVGVELTRTQTCNGDNCAACAFLRAATMVRNRVKPTAPPAPEPAREPAREHVNCAACGPHVEWATPPPQPASDIMQRHIGGPMMGPHGAYDGSDSVIAPTKDEAERAQPEPARCPTCDSPDPKRHPAVQFEGEVQECRDQWHKPQPEQRGGRYLAEDHDVYDKEEGDLIAQCARTKHAVKIAAALNRSEDRLYHAEDGTWWRDDGERLVAADPPLIHERHAAEAAAWAACVDELEQRPARIPEPALTEFDAESGYALGYLHGLDEAARVVRRHAATEKQAGAK